MEVIFEQHEGLKYLFAGPKESSKAPIVLVHGAFMDAHNWEGNFLEYFAEQGHPTYAIFLKDPHHQPYWHTLFAYRIKDYVKQLDKLLAFLTKPAYLVGHSMGGLIIQKYLSHTDRPALGACLLASLAPFGMKHTVQLMMRHPQRLLAYTILTLQPEWTRPYPAPKGLLATEVSDQIRKRFQHLTVRESALALAGCLWPKINKEQVKRTPLLILGAELDSLALARDVSATGDYYDIPVHIYPDLGHVMMMETNWVDIAQEIQGHLASLTLDSHLHKAE